MTAYHVRDHPRSRGNNTAPVTNNGNRRGSPPLAREQLLCLRVCPQKRGITPARAGTTLTTLLAYGFFRDHPRSRGNNQRRSFRQRMSTGSPPLAREQLIQQLRSAEHTGITPARAGTTQNFRYDVSLLWDHPRSRGNNSKKIQ